MAEIIEALVELMKRQPEASGGWLRSAEIQKALGLSHKTTMKYLHELNDAGRLETSYVATRAITGYETRSPAYRLKNVQDG